MSYILNAYVLVALVILFEVFILLWAVMYVTRRKKAVCYRCNDEISGRDICSYMGLSYCSICNMVVTHASSLIKSDPPYGFPGAPGHIMKEKSRG